jgi:hypothetical protein
MTPADSGGIENHPDLLQFAAGPLATFDATVSAPSPWSESNPHPTLADLDGPARRMGIVCDWVVRMVTDGWELDAIHQEAHRRLKDIQDLGKFRQGGTR